jgi:hypothetical protein
LLPRLARVRIATNMPSMPSHELREWILMVRKTVIALCLLLVAALAFGQQNKKAPAERTVTGIVTDESGAPVPGAIVQLENMKTMQIRSFVAKDKGDYYFHGLGMDVDYRLKAESNGKTSATRTVSSFDSHPEVTINLQLK